MNENLTKEIALLRYSLIAPVVNNTYTYNSKIDYFRSVASKKYLLSNGKEYIFSPNTIKGWYLKYNHGGFDALFPKSRNDYGVPRALGAQATERINEIKEQFPHITGTLVYHKLIEEGTINKKDTSLSTVLRYIRDHNLKANQLSGIERKAFEMEYANDCWQADTSHGPVITIDGKKHKTYIIMFIDDASRLIIGAGIFLNDNAVNMQIVFKKAVAKYGVPKKTFVDNGSTYKNEQLSMICASIGTVLIHARAYSAASKGKIERSFRTLKDKWMNGLDWNQFKSLDELNNSLNNFINEDYNNSKHSGINNTPKLRFIQDQKLIKYIPKEELENNFLHREDRKVMNDATIKINTISFEVPQKYIGQRVNVRYYPGDLSKAFLFDNKEKIEIYPLKKVDNSKIKRKNSPIDYSKVSGGTGNV